MCPVEEILGKPQKVKGEKKNIKMNKKRIYIETKKMSPTNIEVLKEKARKNEESKV